MASKNNQLTNIPRLDPFVVPDKNVVSESWFRWFNKIKFYITSDNHQVIDNIATTINLDSNYIALKATTASYAITLDAPTIDGKHMTIQMTERSNPRSVTLSLTNVIGGSASTTATFDAVNETLILESGNGKWAVIREIGVTLT